MFIYVADKEIKNTAQFLEIKINFDKKTKLYKHGLFIIHQIE